MTSAERRVEVFMSATSGDLRSVREAAKQALLTMGYYPVEQANFPPDYRSVREMLTERIRECDAILHIVGCRYGAEPNPDTVPQGQVRESYTQMEVRIARELGKKVYIFVCPPDFPYDPSPIEEPEDKRQLQQAYRLRLGAQEALRTPIKSHEEVAVRIREIQLELDQLTKTLRKDRRHTAVILGGILLILGFIAFGVWWTALRTPKQTVDLIGRQPGSLSQQYYQEITRPREPGDTRTEQQVREQAYGLVAEYNAVDAAVVRKAVERFVAIVHADPVEQAKAYYIGGKYQQAMRSADAAAAANVAEARKALLVAADSAVQLGQFDEAEARYRKAVALVDRSDLTTWLQTCNRLADFLSARGAAVDPSTGNANLREAGQMLRSMLDGEVRQKVPQGWALTQHNLGNALQEQGVRTDGSDGPRLLGEAVAAYREALKVRTEAALPQAWAATQNNLGLALQEQGVRTDGSDGPRLLGEAVAAYREALKVYTHHAAVKNWSETLGHIASAAYRALLANQPQWTEVWSREVIAAFTATASGGDPVPVSDYRWVYTNLATSLLVQNRYDEALVIYREYWNQPVNDSTTFGQAVLGDFEELKKHGVTHQDMARIRKEFAYSGKS